MGRPRAPPEAAGRPSVAPFPARRRSRTLGERSSRSVRGGLAARVGSPRTPQPAPGAPGVYMIVNFGMVADRVGGRSHRRAEPARDDTRENTRPARGYPPQTAFIDPARSHP